MSTRRDDDRLRPLPIEPKDEMQSAESVPRLDDFFSRLPAKPLDETPRTSNESLGVWDSPLNVSDHIINEDKFRQSSPHQFRSTNPFHRPRSSERTTSNIAAFNVESSVDVWADVVSSPPPQPLVAPPPPPAKDVLTNEQSLATQIGDLSLSDDLSQNRADGLSSWNGNASVADEHDDLISLEDREHIFASLPTQSLSQHQSSNLDTKEQWWNEVHEDSSNIQPILPELPRSNITTIPEGIPLPYRIKEERDAPSLAARPNKELTSELRPGKLYELEDNPPQQPSRPRIMVPTEIPPPRSPKTGLETRQTQARRERGETYQIKQVTWFDASSPSNPRRSPIMIQNANGPCPLLALVNALTLSTPANMDSALIETLRVREQVSLGLLLDAVFDELMSRRRGDAVQELPDVGELYAFLSTLDKGMNVNPRFVPQGSQMPNIMDASMIDLPSTIRTIRQPGGFEETNEMLLYSTFAIPLIHGWLPPRSHPAFSALNRSAKTYEDAQNLMFREEELEDKLQQRGLNQEEQLLFEDIAVIKYFLSSSATQLTSYGLNIISDTLTPGSIVILFRNDHFSTLYKHPRSGQLLTLVTDMGYAGHDEVVWESLADVSGEACEFYAGDFRLVSHVAGNNQQQGTADQGNDQGWATVSRRSRNAEKPKPAPSQAPVTQAMSTSSLPLAQDFSPPLSPNAEQEDHDLALAMQLQEEEEDRSRRESAARKREDELSEAYLSSRETRPQPVSVPRRQEVRSLVPPRGGSTVRRDPEAGDDAPPPSYEQAAKSTPYSPPAGPPPRASAASPSIGSSGGRPQGVRPRQSSAYAEHAAISGVQPSTHRRSSAVRGSTPYRGGGVVGPDGAPGVVRRRSAGPSPRPVDGDDDGKKDCAVM